MLSLVLIVIIVGNVFLSSYQMNQLDWEKMRENIKVLGEETTSTHSTQTPSEQPALLGGTSLVDGDISDLTANDGGYMIFRSYASATGIADYVDDSHVDVGTQSNFTAQQYGPDSIYDILTEGNTESGSGSFGSSSGSSYTTVSANQTLGSMFTSPEDSEGATISSISWYGRTSTGNGNAKAILVLASTKEIVAISDAVAYSASAKERTNTFASPPTISGNTDYILMMIFDVPTRLYYSSGTANQGYLDTTNNYYSPVNPIDATNNNNKYRIHAHYDRKNYELDIEVEWTDVDFSQPNEQLCIYGGTMGDENLLVEVWNDGEWETVFSDLVSGWNNVSVSLYLTSETFTIRFRGDTEMEDYLQESWNIDATLLCVGPNEYTSEVEFSGLSNPQSWTQLSWSTDTAWTTGSVSVTIQLYNFTLGAYPTSGNGFVSYTSSDTPNFNENANQTISDSPSDFRNSTGYWKIKIKGTLTGATQFDFKADCIEVETAASESTQMILVNEGAVTAHIVSIWVTDSALHQRYGADYFLNSGESTNQIFDALNLPSTPYVLKVITERGNVAIYSNG